MQEPNSIGECPSQPYVGYLGKEIKETSVIVSQYFVGGLNIYGVRGIKQTQIQLTSLRTETLT